MKNAIISIFVMFLVLPAVFAALPSFTDISHPSDVYQDHDFNIEFSIVGTDLTSVELDLRIDRVRYPIDSQSCSSSSCSGTFEISLSDLGQNQLVLVARDQHGSRTQRFFFIDVIEAPQTYEWFEGDWGECDADCDGGEQTRVVECRDNYDEVVADSFCGDDKPIETQECNTQSCTVDCVVSDWTPWSECSEECDGGTQNRSREILVEPAYGGLACPHLFESQECNTHSCPVITYTWHEGDWGECDADCDGGEQTRVVECRDGSGNTVDDSFCPAPKPADTQACNTHSCSASPLITLTPADGSDVDFNEGFNVVCSTDSDGDVSLYRDGEPISNNTLESPAAGTYEYSCEVSETDNFAYGEVVNTITVNRINPVASLTNTRDWTFVYDGTPAEIGISADNFGDSDVEYRLYRNNTFVGTSNEMSTPGVYVYRIVSTEGQNYSSVTLLDEKTLIINENVKEEGDISLWIRGIEVDGDLVQGYPEGQQSNPLAAESITGQEILLSVFANGNLMSNFFDVSYVSGSYSGLFGVYEITAVALEDSQFEEASVNGFLNITRSQTRHPAPYVESIIFDEPIFGFENSFTFSYDHFDCNDDNAFEHPDKGDACDIEDVYYRFYVNDVLEDEGSNTNTISGSWDSDDTLKLDLKICDKGRGYEFWCSDWFSNSTDVQPDNVVTSDYFVVNELTMFSTSLDTLFPQYDTLHHSTLPGFMSITPNDNVLFDGTQEVGVYQVDFWLDNGPVVTVTFNITPIAPTIHSITLNGVNVNSLAMNFMVGEEGEVVVDAPLADELKYTIVRETGTFQSFAGEFNGTLDLKLDAVGRYKYTIDAFRGDLNSSAVFYVYVVDVNTSINNLTPHMSDNSTSYEIIGDFDNVYGEDDWSIRVYVERDGSVDFKETISDVGYLNEPGVYSFRVGRWFNGDYHYTSIDARKETGLEGENVRPNDIAGPAGIVVPFGGSGNTDVMLGPHGADNNSDVVLYKVYRVYEYNFTLNEFNEKVYDETKEPTLLSQGKFPDESILGFVMYLDEAEGVFYWENSEDFWGFALHYIEDEYGLESEYFETEIDFYP